MEKRLELDPGDLVTAEMLLRAGACKTGVWEFHNRFPDGVELTLENLLEAADAGLDVDWFGMVVFGLGSDYDVAAYDACDELDGTVPNMQRVYADILWSHL